MLDTLFKWFKRLFIKYKTSFKNLKGSLFKFNRQEFLNISLKKDAPIKLKMLYIIFCSFTYWLPPSMCSIYTSVFWITLKDSIIIVYLLAVLSVWYNILKNRTIKTKKARFCLYFIIPTLIYRYSKYLILCTYRLSNESFYYILLLLLGSTFLALLILSIALFFFIKIYTYSEAIKLIDYPRHNKQKLKDSLKDSLPYYIYYTTQTDKFFKKFFFLPIIVFIIFIVFLIEELPLILLQHDNILIIYSRWLLELCSQLLWLIDGFSFYIINWPTSFLLFLVYYTFYSFFWKIRFVLLTVYNFFTNENYGDEYYKIFVYTSIVIVLLLIWLLKPIGGWYWM